LATTSVNDSPGEDVLVPVPVLELPALSDAVLLPPPSDMSDPADVILLTMRRVMPLQTRMMPGLMKG
jgi:hypothetical protein